MSFLYTGDVAIIGGGYDGTSKTAQGNSLVQFINLEKTLPASVDVKIYELYTNDNGGIYLKKLPPSKMYVKISLVLMQSSAQQNMATTALDIISGFLNREPGRNL